MRCISSPNVSGVNILMIDSRSIHFTKAKQSTPTEKITNNALSTAKKFDREKFLVGYNKKIQSILNDI